MVLLTVLLLTCFSFLLSSIFLIFCCCCFAVVVIGQPKSCGYAFMRFFFYLRSDHPPIYPSFFFWWAGGRGLMAGYVWTGAITDYGSWFGSVLADVFACLILTDHVIRVCFDRTRFSHTVVFQTFKRFYAFWGLIQVLRRASPPPRHIWEASPAMKTLDSPPYSWGPQWVWPLAVKRPQNLVVRRQKSTDFNRQLKKS